MPDFRNRYGSNGDCDYWNLGTKTKKSKKTKNGEKK